ncbi:acyltransferase family protein [Lewinella sp. LCG006]|uniref:acyltransferase family protein n=1 Tax=Lewinella sp. LCG006 TaxID=3231911 RepID=UPI00346083DA
MPSLFAKIPERLMRITSSGRYIAEVDGLRFMAIMPVLVQHLSERTQRYAAQDWATPLADNFVAFWASRGTIGVFLFFAISGFILGLPFAKYHLQGGRKVGLSQYFWRRLTRLEPPYMVWMVIFFLVLLVKGSYSFGELFPHLGASLGYLHNIVYEDYSVINPVAWSLEIEIQFYLLAPVLAWMFFRWPNKWLRRGLMAAATIGILVAQQRFGWVAMPYKLTLLWQLQYFLVGFLVADFFLVDWQGQNKAKGVLVWDFLAVAALLVMALSWSAEMPKRLVFCVALLGFLVAGFRGRFFTAFLRRPWIAAIGGMCYTIYLIHLPLLEGLTPLTNKLAFTNSFGIHLLWQALLLFPVVFVVSAAGFLWLEKPCMDKDWPAKLWAWIRNSSLVLNNIKES